ncbi:MAG: methanol/ethanol family PQQ-dependent dehydrogenase [Phycisphaerae bacterium]|nr:methanol/ethanol family PQQ-dependent dehydrogenase [Gemmatimonadaceae bacterium]
MSCWRRGALRWAPVALAIAAGCDKSASSAADGNLPATPTATSVALSPSDSAQAALDAQDDGQWLMAAKDYASTRYSGLNQITTSNVGSLKLAWSFSTGVLRGHEGAPLVIGSTMYLVTPHPNHLYAIDLNGENGGGTLKWKYDPEVSLAAPGVACCDVVNRGAAYHNGKIIFNTLDNHTIAVDATTGLEVWNVKLGEINQGETMTMAPLIVKGKVLVGNSGGEFGVRGWITAVDAESGDIEWRAYASGPDTDVLIGPEFRPFYAADRAKDLGVTSWPPDQWRLGGGTVWGWISYDPELDLVYYGTGNPGVWNPAQRRGDNKWASSIFARDPDTGMARWAYQWTPHDEHDYDGINEQILLDLPLNGNMRKVLLRPERNGFMYMLDRVTGEVLSADPFGHVTWATGIDLKTGRPILNPDKETGNRLARDVCPASPGMKDWQPTAWSPRTKLLYIPQNNLCMDYQGMETGYIAGTPYVGAQVKMYAAPGGHRGMFSAWDPIARRKVWEIKEMFPAWSGAVVTAGDVVFYGTMDRWFKAVHARTGELLWKFQAGSGIIGQPITYRGPDGKQYVAVLSGVGGWAGAAALGILPEDDPHIALGFAHAMKDLPKYTSQGGMLYVFALPD